jgi:hypothetical protein
VAEPIAQQAQVFESSLLDVVSPAGRPRYMGAYQTSNQLLNALAHLIGQDGRYSRLLACDESGVLKVQATALDTIVAWDLPALAGDVDDIKTAAELVAAWNFGTMAAAVVTYLPDLDGILAILTDVWDTGAHAIRTTT